MNIKYTYENLSPVVSTSTSWTNLASNIGKSPRGGILMHFKKICIRFNIDYSHFVGQHWSRNKEILKRRKSIDQYLVCGSTITSAKLRKKILNAGLLPNECNMCHQLTWLGYSMPLELHHIDHNHVNNELSNLELLCPNCHTIKTIHYSQLGGMHTRKS